MPSAACHITPLLQVVMSDIIIRRSSGWGPVKTDLCDGLWIAPILSLFFFCKRYFMWGQTEILLVIVQFVTSLFFILNMNYLHDIYFVLCCL